MKRATLDKILTFFMRNLTRCEYVGLENLPKEGGVIIALNHLSHLDTGMLMVNPKRSDITALVTDKYKKYAVIRWFIDTADGIWIDRERADFTAFRQAQQELSRGKLLGIAPEGTRSKDFKLQQGKPGTILLTMKTDAPIVPVAITGTGTGFQQIFRLHRPHLIARFGKPFRLPPLDRENRDASMQQQTDEMMCRIAVMLPEQYRGYYADHPRVKELLAHIDEVLPPDASHQYL